MLEAVAAGTARIAIVRARSPGGGNSTDLPAHNSPRTSWPRAAWAAVAGGERGRVARPMRLGRSTLTRSWRGRGFGCQSAC